MTDSADSLTSVLTARHQAVVDAYAAELETQPDLSPHTRAAYAAALRRWLLWLDDPDTDADYDADPLADAAAKRWAITDWRQAAINGQVRGRGGVTFVALSPGTVKATLAGLNDYFLRRGMGGVSVKEVKRPTAAARSPKALRGKDRIRFDRAAASLTGHEAVRNTAIAGVMRYAGLRRAEVCGLDVTDVTLSARKGTLRVVGKGSKVRVVPANPILREALQAWLDQRPTWPGAESTTALFLTRRSGRLAPRTVNDIVADIAKAAGFGDEDPPVVIGPHTLRHTFGTELVRDQGEDLTVVADLMGHENINTTREYTIASEEDLQDAVDGIDTTHLR